MNASEFYEALDASDDPLDFAISRQGLRRAVTMDVDRRIKIMAHDNRYGNCERCGKPCTPCYAQQWRKLDGAGNGWVSSGFGHAKCLQSGEYSNCTTAQGLDQ